MQYDLVFEGGGAKGMVFVGALEEFEARGHTYDRLLGTSAGAITATLLAAGYSSQEMRDALNEKEAGQSIFLGFMGTPTSFERDDIENSVTHSFLKKVDVPLVPEFIEETVDNWLLRALMSQAGYRHLFSFVENGGWYVADKFVTWFQKKLDSGTFQGKPRNFSQMTLDEFFTTTGRPLSVIATDTSSERMLILNHITAPNCPIVWAVRMSMSIPFVWPEVEWQASWGEYNGQAMGANLVVDGGLLSNFPLSLFVSAQPTVTKIMGPKKSEQLLGLLIDEALPVESAPAKASDSGLDFSKLRTVQRITRVINTATLAHDKMVIESFEGLVVRLPAQGYGTTEFDMSDARREALIAAGRTSMQHYFDQGSVVTAALAQKDLRPQPATQQADKVAAQILHRSGLV